MMQGISENAYLKKRRSQKTPFIGNANCQIKPILECLLFIFHKISLHNNLPTTILVLEIHQNKNVLTF